MFVVKERERRPPSHRHSHSPTPPHLNTHAHHTTTVVGKSAFGLFLLWQAVRAGRTAVYISDKAIGCTILHADGQAEMLPHSAFEAFLPVLRDPATVLIYDGDGEGKGRPPHVAATTVLVTSPKRSRFKEFVKDRGLRLYFPVFSRNEIEDLLEAAFPSLHTPEGRLGVWERYSKWGGIPRYVLKQHRPALTEGLRQRACQTQPRQG